MVVDEAPRTITVAFYPVPCTRTPFSRLIYTSRSRLGFSTITCELDRFDRFSDVVELVVAQLHSINKPENSRIDVIDFIGKA